MPLKSEGHYIVEIHDAYLLVQSDIIPKLNRSWAYFVDCMAFNYEVIANEWGCRVLLSQRRLGDAYSYWREDAQRTLKEGLPENTPELDHFKHASFIAFWLKRAIPINESTVIETDWRKIVSVQQSRELDFLQYGNELCVLLIGYQICLYYESVVGATAENVRSIGGDRLAMLRGTRIPQEMLRDFAMILKHKSLSPHALYMMYKALFSQIRRF